MNEFTVPMALADYVPVILFFLAACVLIKDLSDKMRNSAKYLFIAGVTLVCLAGFLKATYKLLYALNVGDFAWMSKQMFPNQSIGFLLAGIGLMMYVLKKGRTYAFIPTMALVGIMVVGLAAMDAGLCFIATKLKRRNALVCFIVSFFMSLCMGYLSTRDFQRASINWIAQFINIAGQALLYTGVNILHRAGLEKF